MVHPVTYDDRQLEHRNDRLSLWVGQTAYERSTVSKGYRGYLESANGTRSINNWYRVYLESARGTGSILSQQEVQGLS